jgi:hypothetical protein
MKTIEEAAEKYAQKMENEDGYVGCSPCWEVAFKAGVEHAQKWISVEDELPEAGKRVLIKLKNGYITTDERVDKRKVFSCFNSIIVDKEDKAAVTHWKYIELK